MFSEIDNDQERQIYSSIYEAIRPFLDTDYDFASGSYARMKSRVEEMQLANWNKAISYALAPIREYDFRKFKEESKNIDFDFKPKQNQELTIYEVNVDDFDTPYEEADETFFRLYEDVFTYRYS